jgi:ABC-type arginine/histidine transport system permease subunit
MYIDPKLFKNLDLLLIILVMPTVVFSIIGLLWAIIHLRYTQNLSASIEIFVYFFSGGLLAGIAGLLVQIYINIIFI